MKLPPVIVRRMLIDPIWIPLALLLCLGFGVLAIVGVLISPLSRRRPLFRLAAFAVIYLLLDACLVVCCAGLWLRYPLAGRRDQAQWSATHHALLRRALRLLVSASRPLFGFELRLQEPPDAERIRGRPLLVLARHGGPGDSFALVDLLMSRYGKRPAIVLKETLRWDPGLDLLLGRLKTCFIRRGDRARSEARLSNLAKTLRADEVILLFPEGGNWTPSRHLGSIARLRRAGRHQDAAEAVGNPNVLPPSPAGILACLRGQADLDILVVAHTGLEDLVSPALIWRALPVSGHPMIVRWWREPGSHLPRGDDGRREWLRLQWAIVDAWIDSRKASAGSPEAEGFHQPA